MLIAIGVWLTLAGLLVMQPGPLWKVTHHARLAEEFGAELERMIEIEESAGERGLGAWFLWRVHVPDWNVFLREARAAGVERCSSWGVLSNPLRREDWPDWWDRIDGLDAIYCGDPSPKPDTTCHGRWIWADLYAGRAYLLAFR